MSLALLIQFLIPVLSPLITAVVKRVVPSIPGKALPFISTAAGLMTGVVQNALDAGHTNLLAAAGLGLAGVAVREFKEAVLPAANGGWPVETKP